MIRTRDVEALKLALQNIDATVRVVGQRLSDGAVAVFVRPTIGVSDLEVLLLLFRDAFLTQFQVDQRTT